MKYKITFDRGSITVELEDQIVNIKKSGKKVIIEICRKPTYLSVDMDISDIAKKLSTLNTAESILEYLIQVIG